MEMKLLNKVAIKRSLGLKEDAVVYGGCEKFRIHCFEFKNINGFNMFGIRDYAIKDDKIYGVVGEELVFLADMVKESHTKKQVMEILNHFYLGLKDSTKMFREKSQNEKLPQKTRETCETLRNDCIKQILLLKTIMNVVDESVK